MKRTLSYLAALALGVVFVPGTVSSADASDPAFGYAQSGQFQGFDDADSPSAFRYKLPLRKGEHVTFTVRPNLLPDRLSDDKFPHGATIAVRVVWQKTNGGWGSAAASRCETTNVPYASPAPVCEWGFEAPWASSQVSSTGEYTVIVEDKTAPRPRRNVTWAISAKRGLAPKH